MSYRLGIDVGGTFTDVVLREEHTGELVTEKILTTPENPCEGIALALLRLSNRGYDLRQVHEVIHGTTLAVNALIERHGARVGLLTTAGFRDILHFGREFRYDVFARSLTFPEPLVPRERRLEVTERIAGEGVVITPLDRDQTVRQVHRLLDAGVEAIAVCLMHSFARPDHELLIQRFIGEIAPDCPVSLSHEVLPQIREYERFSTTVINAYVQPLARKYLQQLGEVIRQAGCTAGLLIMTSTGGTMTVATALRFPVQLLESGPAAGVLISGEIGTAGELTNIFSFDMGGTTAKSCVIRNGQPVISRSYEVARVQRFTRGSGLPVGVPVVDLLEIGAGGGSIAELDSLGLLNVGPRSAGADPGPACYGRGGTQPTVTDANVALGLIDPDSFLGGAMRLDPLAAEAAIRDHVAVPMGISVEEAAEAIHRIVTENMAEAARVHAAELNVDVRALTIVAFGGAGPLHAAALAARLGVDRVIFPVPVGLLAARGLLTAPLAFEFARSQPKDLADLDKHEVDGLLDELGDEARALLAMAGVYKPTVREAVDMCYVGQRYEVTTSFARHPESGIDLASLRRLFNEAYENAYGRRLNDVEARCLTWRVSAYGPKPLSSIEIPRPSITDAASRSVGERTAVFNGGGRQVCRVYRREQLAFGEVLEGPSLIEENASTIVIPPGAVASLETSGDILLTYSSS